MPLAYKDGQFLDKSDLTVNPADFGFARGITVFELARLYGGIPFRLKDHLDRMANSAGILGIACPLTHAELTAIVQHISARNNYPHSVVKFYLTAGECGHAPGLSFAACDKFTPHLMIMEDPVHIEHPEMPYGAEIYRRGQHLKIVPFEREMPEVKSTNYMMGYHAARAHAGKDWDDILFTHRDGYITEATRSNFFCVIDGTLCTAGKGMLHGITRKVILELAAQNKIPVAERDLFPDDIKKSTEAFTTSSVGEIFPAGKVDNHTMPTVMDGPVFRKLRQALNKAIAEACPGLAKAG